ncbi:MAG: glycoside hydrolase family 15 protein [Gemmatimonadaceae bacterium]|nr:glycoside hydrolase family 15 protein [Gemmatimonadaceae bacterium]
MSTPPHTIPRSARADDLAALGLIGNCQIAAHVRRDGAIVWSCMPRFDSPPIFGALLDGADGGAFRIGAPDGREGEQRYLENTNVLETIIRTPDGDLRVMDFAPRFTLHDRAFRPKKIVRIVEPISGTPRICVQCDPILGWSKDRPRRETGSHHITYRGYPAELRLTTDVPLAYLDGEPFALTGRRHFVLSWGAPVEEPLAPLCDRFLTETVRYWRRWVKQCSIPSRFQHAVIRSALTLKLHCYEDTGAIVAALTTSIPESPRSGRTWDYRYCWLRDAYYALDAFRRLGQFEEREQFLDYLLNIVSGTPELELAPLYAIDGRAVPVEAVLEHWAGYPGGLPVRVGNAASLHHQHDIFGELVLALTPMFVDARFGDQATGRALDLVRRLAHRAITVAGEPDAGIWELRTEWRPQGFSTLMCWAAADRMAQIAERHAPEEAAMFAREAVRIREMLLTRAVDPVRRCLVGDFDGREVDASLLQAAPLGLLAPDDDRLTATIDAVRQDLDLGGWLRRYRIDDGFGTPEVAFTLCSFWLVEALAYQGRLDEAQAILANVATIDAPLGLLAEDLDPSSKRMWGNFPQAYSHVGMIHAAFAASPQWR